MIRWKTCISVATRTVAEWWATAWRGRARSPGGADAPGRLQGSTTLVIEIQGFRSVSSFDYYPLILAEVC